MRLFAILFLVSFLVSACGSDEQKAPPPPNPPSGSAGKWSSDVMQKATETCASKGSGGYSKQQWTTFCSCVYNEAAQRWTYEEFKNNFSQNYSTLKQANVIKNCADKAQIAY